MKPGVYLDLPKPQPRLEPGEFTFYGDIDERERRRLLDATVGPCVPWSFLDWLEDEFAMLMAPTYFEWMPRKILVSVEEGFRLYFTPVTEKLFYEFSLRQQTPIR